MLSLFGYGDDTSNSIYPQFVYPPLVKKPYKKSETLDDLKGVSYALELFLGSKMVEAEEYCHKSDENKCVVSLECGVKGR